MKKSAIELLMEGYDKTEKETLKEGTAEADVIQKDNVEERELTTIEKLMNGYNEDSTQRQKEIEVNPNDIKEEEK